MSNSNVGAAYSGPRHCCARSFSVKGLRAPLQPLRPSDPLRGVNPLTTLRAPQIGCHRSQVAPAPADKIGVAKRMFATYSP